MSLPACSAAEAKRAFGSIPNDASDLFAGTSSNSASASAPMRRDRAEEPAQSLWSQPAEHNSLTGTAQLDPASDDDDSDLDVPDFLK